MLSPRNSHPELNVFDHFPAHYGQTLKEGRYEIQRKLGAGLFATIWLVADTKAKYVSTCLSAELG
jgi:hypothetical protein